MQTRCSKSSRRAALTFSLAACALLASAGTARPDSLFPVKKAQQAVRGSSSSDPASLFSDNRARSVGDLLTLLISESTTAQASANTKTSQDDSVNVFGGAGLFNRIFKEFTLSASNSRAGNGAGQTTRSGTLITTLSVTVREILPNGTLRIEGSRMVGINKEQQRVTFSGIVRPEDIGYDNVIASNLVADVQVRYDGKGIVADTQRQGILTRIFRFLF